MALFNVYPLNPIVITKAEGSLVWDDKGQEYLDMYGGHAVISIGHTHPHWVKRIEDQLHTIAFYSNSVIMPIQEQLAEALNQISGKKAYQLFLCNSGAEANENAMKLASFHTGRKKIIAFNRDISLERYTYINNSNDLKTLFNCDSFLIPNNFQNKVLQVSKFLGFNDNRLYKYYVFENFFLDKFVTFALIIIKFFK